MKKTSFNLLKQISILLIPAVLIFTVISCSDDDPMVEPGEDPIASFQYEISTDNFLQVSFTNFSQNAVSYSWDFGDGNTSTDEDPVHTYAEAGDYTAMLTATNVDGKSATFSESFTLTDPNEALKLLTGETSKTWKLYREGTSMSLGESADVPDNWWAGLENDGSRPCLYEQEFTFYLDGTYEFDDNGMFWGEFGVWGGGDNCAASTDFFEECFEAIPANMVNCNGDDVSAWLSGTHSFTYDPATGTLSLLGTGAWIGIPKLGTTGEFQTPQSSVDTKITIEQFTGYDVMLVEFDFGAGGYWPIRYASYSDPSLEPELQTGGPPPFGEDYPDISPTELSNAFDGNFVLLDTIVPSASTVVYGVDDPADANAAKVGQFNRTTEQYQELQFQTSPTKNDINFENLTTISLDVYLPSSNDYSGSLTTAIIIGIGDKGATEQWWTDQTEYHNDGSGIALDTWTTLTFNIDDPDYVAKPDTAANPYGRNDYDMIYINIGGSGHTDPGTFYLRNFKFE